MINKKINFRIFNFTFIAMLAFGFGNINACEPDNNIKVAFWDFPIKLKSEKDLIRAEVKNYKDLNDVKSYLHAKIISYCNSKIAISYYFNDTSYYLMKCNGHGKVEDFIITGTRDLPVQINNEQAFNKFWKDSAIVFDTLKVNMNMASEKLKAILFTCVTESCNDVLIEKDQERLTVFAKDQKALNNCYGIMAQRDGMSDTLFVCFVNVEFKTHMKEIYHEFKEGGFDDIQIVAAILRYYDGEIKFNTSSLMEFLKRKK